MTYREALRLQDRKVAERIGKYGDDFKNAEESPCWSVETRRFAWLPFRDDYGRFVWLRPYIEVIGGIALPGTTPQRSRIAA